MEKRITKVVLTILSTAVVACGSAGAASVERSEPASGGAFLTADDNYGVGERVELVYGDGSITVYSVDPNAAKIAAEQMQRAIALDQENERQRLAEQGKTHVDAQNMAGGDGDRGPALVP